MSAILALASLPQRDARCSGEPSRSAEARHGPPICLLPASLLARVCAASRAPCARRIRAGRQRPARPHLGRRRGRHCSSATAAPKAAPSKCRCSPAIGCARRRTRRDSVRRRQHAAPRRNTTVDFQSDELVRLLEGRVRLIDPGPAGASPTASTRRPRGCRSRSLANTASRCRRTAARDELELAVLRGSAELVNEDGPDALRAGERAFAARRRAPSYAYVFNSAAWDAFDRWSEARREQRLGVSAQYSPTKCRPYAATLDQYGSWRYEPAYGYVWYPRVAVGWRPYYYGRWSTLPAYGWTWIGSDPWAWPTHHYGRWGFSAGPLVLDSGPPGRRRGCPGRTRPGTSAGARSASTTPGLATGQRNVPWLRPVARLDRDPATGNSVSNFVNRHVIDSAAIDEANGELVVVPGATSRRSSPGTPWRAAPAWRRSGSPEVRRSARSPDDAVESRWDRGRTSIPRRDAVRSVGRSA